MVYVIASRTGIVTHNGIPVTVREGDRYTTDDPIVREFPWLFDPDVVEQATAAPGEKRTTRARRK